MRRATKVLLIFVAGLLVLAGLGWGYVCYENARLRASLPELARDMPANFAEGDLVFKARVKTRFPVGMREADIVDELQRQGFTLATRETVAQFRQPGFVCNLVWNVFWKADADGTVSSVDGAYGAVCL